jgi:chemotaxis protein MotB
MRLSELQAQSEEQGANPFFISLSDLMTLLCVFFLVIVSMSDIQTGSFETIRSSIRGNTKGTLVELATNLKRIVDKDPGVPGVRVRLAPDGVRLDLDTAALFETGSAVLQPNALVPLRPLLLAVLKTNYRIDVEGHTDDRPFYRRVGDEIDTNWSLSGRRASSVLQHLIDLGISDTRVRIVGYASTRPKTDPYNKHGDDLERARADNRRVSLLIR